MDKKEAQFILSAYRPNRQDSSDRQVAAALKVAEQDPELMEWFESETRFDSLIAEKLKQVRPPEGLREQILSGMNLAESSAPWWRQPPIMAIAATIIVVFGLLLSWNRPTYDSEFDELRANAVSYAAGFISLDYFAEALPDLSGWLSAREAPSTDELAGYLDSLPGIGCRTLNWSGKTVSLICLQGDTVVHVFMVERDAVDGLPESEGPQFWEVKKRTVASWSDAERVYVLVTKAPMDEVKLLL